MPTVNDFKTRLRDLKRIKQPWITIYQRLSETYLNRRQDFETLTVDGEFLDRDVYDNTGQFAATLMASSFLSMMWPDAARTFRLKPVRRLAEVSGAEEFFNRATDEMHGHMDNPTAGLQIALGEHFMEQGVFGTSGPAAFENKNARTRMAMPVTYESWDVKRMWIGENAQGFVDTVYFVKAITVRQLLREYAKDSISPKVHELAKSNKLDDIVEVLHAIEPRDEAMVDKNLKGIAAMDWISAHVDITNDHIMRQGGYEEMPVFVARAVKRVGEVYARCSGMTGMADANSLNALREGVLVATEKQLAPPLGVLDDGRLGGAVIDTSPNGITVFNTSGRIATTNPIFPLYTVGELNSAKDLSEQLKESLFQSFYLDRLLDLNNSTQMTAFEASIRNRMRGEALSSMFSRQEMEVFTPLIKRTFNILYRGGWFGIVDAGVGAEVRRIWARILGQDRFIIPKQIREAITAGLPVFDIEYTSPAKRFMQAEKLQGIFTATDALVALQPIMPQIMDIVDPDILGRNIIQLSGMPRDSQRTVEAVTKLRADMAKQQQAVAMLEAAKQASEVARNSAQARATLGTGRQANGGK